MLSVALVAGALAGISTSTAQAQTAGGYGPLRISCCTPKPAAAAAFWLRSRHWRSRATAAAGRATR
jgi:hypothetical protein